MSRRLIVWAVALVVLILAALYVSHVWSSAWNWFPWSVESRLERAEKDRDTAQADLKLARQERDAAVDSLDKYKGLTLIDAQTQAVVCDTRVREARVSARRIESIINREVPHDADGSPSRVLISGRELRQALQPALAAEPLH